MDKKAVWVVSYEHSAGCVSVHTSWAALCLRYPGASDTHGHEAGDGDVSGVGAGFYFDSVDVAGDYNSRTYKRALLAEYFAVEG